MRVPRRSFFASLSIAALVLGLLPFSASAQVPHDTAFQGVLKDEVGAPLTGPVDLVLRIFELPSGGSALYTETQFGVAIDPMNGSFLVQLGFGTTDLDTDGDGAPEANAFSFDSSLFENGPNRYLEVQVGTGVSGEILAPRQMIGSVPYALVAEDVVTDPATSTVGALIAAAQSAADTAQAAADTADSNHTIDTQLTSAEVAAAATAQGFVTGAHTVDSNTTYTAGSGLTLTGTTFSTGSQGPHDRPGSANTAVGGAALRLNDTGNSNTGIGQSALDRNTDGDGNTATGFSALRLNRTGSFNTAVGVQALERNTVGSSNIAVGASAGRNTTGDSNIMIGNSGVAGDSATMRLGSAQTRTFVAGVAGTTLAGAVENVVVDASGQFGVSTEPATRFEACADGLTVADHDTGLLWERKTGIYDGDVSVLCELVVGGCSTPHEVNNQYEWSNTGTEPDGNTYTDFLARLNGWFDPASRLGCFANSCVWRLPEISELQTILVGPASGPGQDILCTSAPCIDPDFASVGGPTASNLYQSASPAPSGSLPRWVALFGLQFSGPLPGLFDQVDFHQTFNEFGSGRALYVRAVRAGSCGP